MFFLFISLLIYPCYFSTPTDLPVPYPTGINEIKPTLSIYSPHGHPPCLTIPTYTEKGSQGLSAAELVHIAQGYGVFSQVERVIIITHGYKDGINSPWLHQLKNALITQEAQTVIILGWGGGADTYNLKFRKAAGNIRGVGYWLAEFVEELRIVKKGQVGFYIWGIGHSLGAHLLGVAGNKRGDNFDRITGLDPSAPFFEGNKNIDLKLSRHSAKVVDVIHSDGCTVKKLQHCWVKANNHYALIDPVGTLDFYPNYGELNAITNPLEIEKSHTRAVDLFISSIFHKGHFTTNETFEGLPTSRPSHSIQRFRSVGVTAEMGYWLQKGFIPGEGDNRKNFFVAPELLKILDENESNRRRRRELMHVVDCLVVPSVASFGAHFSLILAGHILFFNLILL